MSLRPVTSAAPAGRGERTESAGGRSGLFEKAGECGDPAEAGRIVGA